MKCRRRQVLALLVLLLPAAATSRSGPPGSSPRQDGTAPKPSNGSQSLALTQGEMFEMEIHWRPPVWLFFIPPISAGRITLEVRELLDYQQSPAARIVGEVKSSGTFNSLAGTKVENRYESLLDLKSACSRQFKFMRREGKRMQDVQIDIDSEARKLQVREWNVAKDPHVSTRDERIDLPESCIQDLLSIFYVARTLPLEPGLDSPLVLCSDHGKVQQIRLQVEGEENIKTDAGAFQAYRISTSGLFGGLFRSGGEFKVWLDKGSRIPVKFDAKVKLGRVTGSLVSYVSAQPLIP